MDAPDNKWKTLIVFKFSPCSSTKLILLRTFRANKDSNPVQISAHTKITTLYVLLYVHTKKKVFVDHRRLNMILGN